MKYGNWYIPTRDFFDWMELWFKNKGIELSCNADGSILWSKSGWNWNK